jgi:hypothetical protein
LSSPETAWDGWIAPETIVGLVRNTAPFLFIGDPGAARPFLQYITDNEASRLTQYFALCVAAHHATVATFVPTDVDTKIRGLIWRKTRDEAELRWMADFAFGWLDWDLAPVSRRFLGAGTRLGETVSGHNGEWLSVVAGGHGRFLAVGDAEYAERTAEAIDRELEREASAFLTAFRAPGREIETLKLAASLTHNLGDLDQGISFWEGPAAKFAASKARFARLAHENTKPYSGVFQISARLYRDWLAPEGHRHYPLRPLKCLRQSAELLLPQGPFLDEWGGIAGTHPDLTTDDRTEVLDALIKGCKKVPGQSGYFRAIAGFAEAAPRAFAAALDRVPASSRKELRQAAFQKQLAVSRASFESSMKKRVQALRDSLFHR